ncbi:hypothetical protein ACFCZ1_37240 [Streptomyces sp. NPDC056224]|uniref:hypothetical protein n=1 Tax=Streptomyces sp. NPDC056224 TaxID=3345750 RepID=UPI0035E3496F
MSDRNAYIANASEVRSTADLIDKIAAVSRSIVDGFAAASSSTHGWEGDDSYGRSLRPQLANEHDTTLRTGQAVTAAVTAIADGSLANAGNILSTQGANLDSISRSAGRTATDDTARKH